MAFHLEKSGKESEKTLLRNELQWWEGEKNNKTGVNEDNIQIIRIDKNV